jgi:HK97 family phage prohead protease
MAEEIQTLIRTFDAELEETGDGRTLEGICVPYNIATTVDDGMGPYQEMFVKGAFGRAVKAPNRVYLNFEHKPGISNVLGHGVEFDERDDGLYGKLQIEEGPDGAKAMRLWRQQVLTSLSVEFKPMGKQTRNEAGIVERRSVHLDAVALCRVGAYDEARVLAIRTDPVLDVDPIPVFDPELAARLEQNGILVPRRLRTELTI